MLPALPNSWIGTMFVWWTFPAALASLWKRCTAWGLAAGILAGFLTAVLWVEVPALKGLVYELAPAFAIATLAIVAVSLWTAPRSGTPR